MPLEELNTRPGAFLWEAYPGQVIPATWGDDDGNAFPDGFLDGRTFEVRISNASGIVDTIVAVAGDTTVTAEVPVPAETGRYLVGLWDTTDTPQIATWAPLHVDDVGAAPPAGLTIPIQVVYPSLTIPIDFHIGGGGASSGPAGGVLGGTYPDPTFAIDMATQAELDANTVAWTAAITAAVDALKNGAPASGDTLNELHARLAVIEALGSLATDAELIAAVASILGSADTDGDTLGELQALIGLRLLKSANLSDLPNVATARANLSVYSIAAVDAIVAGLSATTVALPAGTGPTDVGKVLSLIDDDPLTTAWIAPRLGGPQVVGFGDSVMVALEDSSTNRRVAARSWLAQTIWSTGGKLTYLMNAGVGGQDSAELLARVDTDVIALDPDICIFGIPTNDPGNNRTLQFTIDNVSAIVDALQAAGIFVVMANLTPRGNAQTGVVLRNAWLAGFCADRKLPHLDLHAQLVDPATGGMKAEYLNGSDEIHPNSIATKVLGRYAADALDAVLPPFRPYLSNYNTDPQNLVDNGLFLDETGGVPDGWTLPADADITYSLVDDANMVGKALRIQRAGVTSGLTRTVTQTLATTPTAGSNLAVSCRIEIADDPSIGDLTYNARLFFTGGTEPKRWNFIGSGRAGIRAGSVAYMDCVVPVGTTSVTLDIDVPPGTLDIKIGQITVIDKTALGIDGGEVPADPPGVEYADPVIVQSKNASTNTTLTMAQTFDAAPTPGNLLVAVHWAGAAHSTVTPPDGWTYIIHQNRSSAPSIRIYYRVADGTEGTVTFTNSGAVNQALAIFEVTGIDTDAAVDRVLGVDGGAVGVTALPVGPSAITSSVKELAIVAIGPQNTVTFLNTWTNGYTQRAVNVKMSVATKILTDTEATSTAETWTTSRTAVGVLATFRTKPV